eukprot:gene4515-5630_t
MISFTSRQFLKSSLRSGLTTWSTVRSFTTAKKIQSSSNTDFYATEEGKVGTFEFSVYFHKSNNGEKVSPWHSIPLHPKGKEGSKVYNFIVEIPKDTNAKMEVATKTMLNPIKQDIKKGQLRYIKYGNLLFNYGCVPQTWEDPNHVDSLTGYKGDNDPVDIVEVSEKQMVRGEIKQVKVLGALALIDEEETDWKVIALDIENPIASKVNNLKDLESVQPGTLSKIQHWYQVYKVAEGKAENKYALNGNPVDEEQTHKILQQTHKHWNQLVNNNLTYTLK